MNGLPKQQPIKVGVLSDTHLARLTPEFEARVAACFAGASIILHAGDLTEPVLLRAFEGQEVHAVHGNMCSVASQKLLPRKKVITLGGFTIGLIHRVSDNYDFEDRLRDEFEQVDCIVYGHTHWPTCHESDGILYLNPGSFLATSRFGHPGTYAILEIGDRLRATIYEVPF